MRCFLVGYFKKINTIRKYNNKTKIIATLGSFRDGERFQDRNMAKILSDSGNHDTFVNNLLHFVETYNFDGINIYLLGLWRAFRDEVMELVAKISKVFKSKKLLVTCDVSPLEEEIDIFYDVSLLKNYVDYVIVNSDFQYGDQLASHFSPLRMPARDIFKRTIVSFQFLIMIV